MKDEPRSRYRAELAGDDFLGYDRTHAVLDDISDQMQLLTSATWLKGTRKTPKVASPRRRPEVKNRQPRTIAELNIAAL